MSRILLWKMWNFAYISPLVKRSLADTNHSFNMENIAIFKVFLPKIKVFLPKNSTISRKSPLYFHYNLLFLSKYCLGSPLFFTFSLDCNKIVLINRINCALLCEFYSLFRRDVQHTPDRQTVTVSSDSAIPSALLTPHFPLIATSNRPYVVPFPALQTPFTSAF